MATVTDDFNRGDSSTLGADWTDQIAGIGIASNEAARVADPGFFERFAYWSANSFDADHDSQAIIKNFGATNNCTLGVTVRASGTGGSMNCYMLYIQASNNFLFKIVAGATTLLQTYSAPFAIDDVMGISATGTTIKSFRNGLQIGTDVTDSDLATGSAGILLSNNTGSSPVAALDDWSASGAIVAGGQPATKRWGGVPHMGTQKFRNGGGGGPWAKSDAGIYLRRAA